MNNNDQIVEYNPGQASLLEMRSDSTRFPRLKTLPKEEAAARMSRIIYQAFLYRGQDADPDTIAFISSALVAELLDDRVCGSGNLSLAEIQVVVKRAVLNGDLPYGVNVASLYKVITDYAKGEGHRLQAEVDNKAREQHRDELKRSIIAPMLQAYTGEFIRKQKSNNNEQV